MTMLLPDKLEPERLTERSTVLRPWSIEGLVRLVSLNLFAVLLVAASTYQVVRQDGTTDQALAWFNLGVLGVGIAGVANALWIFRGRRAVGLARSALFAPWTTGDATAALHAVDDDGQRLGLRSSDRFHRPGCPMVAGKQVQGGSWEGFVESGRTACEICQP